MGSNDIRYVPDILFKSLLITFVCQSCLYYNDLYDLKITDSMGEMGIRLLQALGAAAILLAIVYFFFPPAIIGRGVFEASVALVIFMIASWRFGYMYVLDRGLFDQKIVLIGSGELARNILKEVVDKRDSGYQVPLVLTECDEDAACIRDIFPKCRCQNNYQGLVELVRGTGSKTLVVAMGDQRGAFPRTSCCAVGWKGSIFWMGPLSTKN